MCTDTPLWWQDSKIHKFLVIQGLLKSFVKQCPSLPHLPPLLWNVEEVLYHLARYCLPDKPSFRLLVKKTLTQLLLATTCHRADVLALLVDPQYLWVTSSRINAILQHLTKTYTPKCKWVQELTIYNYKDDPTICPYTYLIYYLLISNQFREKDAEAPWIKFRKYMWFWGDQKIRLYSLLQWVSMRKQSLRHNKIKKTFVQEITLQKYTSLWIDLTYVLVFTVYLRMLLIFTNFLTGSKQIGKNHMVIVYFLLGNLWISEASPDTL